MFAAPNNAAAAISIQVAAAGEREVYEETNVRCKSAGVMAFRHAIDGGVTQARIAHETRSGQGRLHINILWEMGGAERVLHGVMEKCKGIIQGVTCGAGMPYKLAEIAAHYGLHYYPIISSGRAFRAFCLRRALPLPEL